MDVKEYFKEIKCCAVHSCDIKEDLRTLKRHLLKIKGIPTVLDVNKTYDAFSFEEIENRERFEATKVILLNKTAKIFSKRFYVHDIKLKLNYKYFSYKELLKDIANIQMGAFEIIGDVIHVNLTEDLLPHKELIGQVLNIKLNKTVVNKTSKIDNVHRNYELEILAGKKEDLKTVVIENNVKIVVDLENVYWCSRLQGERKKLLDEIVAQSKTLEESTTICDLFCGVGPHILYFLNENKKENKYKVIANDINKDAIKCLEESIKLNKMDRNDIDITCSDAKEIIERLRNTKVDHYIFNLPEYSMDFLQLLLSGTNKYSYTAHCYFFCQNTQNVKEFVESKISQKLNELKKVRDVSPSKSVYKLTIHK